MKELVFAGFGGQGILTAGVVISQIVLYKGWKATWLPSYGPSMRGGTANCTVKYDEHYIYTPGMDEPDLLLAMNTPSFKKFQGTLKPGGILLVNSDLVEIFRAFVTADLVHSAGNHHFYHIFHSHRFSSSILPCGAV